jgi:hypothetical protein
LPVIAYKVPIKNPRLNLPCIRNFLVTGKRSRGKCLEPFIESISQIIKGYLFLNLAKDMPTAAALLMLFKIRGGWR